MWYAFSEISSFFYIIGLTVWPPSDAISAPLGGPAASLGGGGAAPPVNMLEEALQARCCQPLFGSLTMLQNAEDPKSASPKSMPLDGRISFKLIF